MVDYFCQGLGYSGEVDSFELITTDKQERLKELRRFYKNFKPVLPNQKRFVIGDIHGNYKALVQVLKKSGFDYQKDKLIIIGDIVDGFEQSFEAVEELLKIKNKIFVRGNHDNWFLDYFITGEEPLTWLSQGGEDTLNSYKKNNKGKIPQTHKTFFKKSKLYHVEPDNILFVHAGYKTDKKLEEQPFNLMWDRELFRQAEKQEIKEYKEIFIGHTTTQKYGIYLPVKNNNLWMIDCGAGWNGKLCLMNIDTKQYWLSRKSKTSKRWAR